MGVWKDEGRMGFVPSVVPYVFVSFCFLVVYDIKRYKRIILIINETLAIEA
jgi:hypothetical protein